MRLRRNGNPYTIIRRHPDIHPVERDCICLQRRVHEPHIAACDGAFRAKFLSALRGLRATLRSEADRHRLFGGHDASPALN